MRAIPTFNHAKVKKAISKEKQLESLDMKHIDRLMSYAHYAQYNQSFMIKSLGATQEEQAKYLDYLDERRESRETRKKPLVEFVLKEREKAKALRDSKLSSP